MVPSSEPRTVVPTHALGSGPLVGVTSTPPPFTHLCGAPATQVVVAKSLPAEIGTTSISDKGGFQARALGAVPEVHEPAEGQGVCK